MDILSINRRKANLSLCSLGLVDLPSMKPLFSKILYKSMNTVNCANGECRSTLVNTKIPRKDGPICIDRSLNLKGTATYPWANEAIAKTWHLTG